jgi:hypothetical protein
MWHPRCRVLSPHDSSLPCRTRSLRNAQWRTRATRSLPPDWYHCLSQSKEPISSEVKPHWASLSLSVLAAFASIAFSRCSSTDFCLFIFLSLWPVSSLLTTGLSHFSRPDGGEADQRPHLRGRKSCSTHCLNASSSSLSNSLEGSAGEVTRHQIPSHFHLLRSRATHGKSARDGSLL